MEVCFKGSLKNLYNIQLTRNEWERIALKVQPGVVMPNDKTAANIAFVPLGLRNIAHQHL